MVSQRETARAAQPPRQRKKPAEPSENEPTELTDPPTGRGTSGAFVPAATRVWVERTTLMRLLDAAASAPLTLVVAPAGTGKTLTMARWTRSRAPLPVSWVSSASDMSPGQLANVIRAANSLEAVPVQPRMPQATLVEQTAEALQDRDAERIVVIDDAHLMTASCFTLIDELLNRCPAALRLVVLCRWDPPIARLLPALHGNLTVIRGNAFQMSDEEARELVFAHSGSLPSDVVDAILERAQGWAAVIVLAARLVASSPDPLESAQHLAEGGFVLADMLASEVFSTLPNRARHLLLCIGSEKTVDAETAAQLTGDPAAGTMLEELEAFGLLVSRDEQQMASGAVRYRVHPLLTEVLRRRLRAGGVEISRARAVLAQAARWSVAHGDTQSGLRRLVAAQAWDDAVALLAERGAELLMLGHGDLVDTVARSAPETIEQTPACWIVVALHRWLSGDYAGATHWYERIIHVHEQDPRRLAPGAALLRLMLARTAREPAIVAVENALRVIDGEDTQRHPSALITWLLIELGAAENWVGRLREAQTHLRWAASAAEAGGIDRLVAAALSHTALTEYMQGRHLNARVSAARALDLLPDDGQDLATVARARVAQELADRPQLSEMPDLIDLSSPASSPAVTDPTTAVWHCVLTSRTLLAEGSVDEAAAALTATRMLPPLPPHLAAAIIGEKAVHALLQNDAAGLAALSGSFAAVGARGESAVVAAFDRDRAGDTRTAVELLGAVASGREECLLPGTRVVAMI